jgi:hypothetical protein
MVGTSGVEKVYKYIVVKYFGVVEFDKEIKYVHSSDTVSCLLSSQR